MFYSRFIVFSCLLVFSFVLAARLDKIIIVNYAIIFMPLWFGEACVFLGFIIGFISFIARPPSRFKIKIFSIILILQDRYSIERGFFRHVLSNIGTYFVVFISNIGLHEAGALLHGERSNAAYLVACIFTSFCSIFYGNDYCNLVHKTRKTFWGTLYLSF